MRNFHQSKITKYDCPFCQKKTFSSKYLFREHCRRLHGGSAIANEENHCRPIQNSKAGNDIVIM